MEISNNYGQNYVSIAEKNKFSNVLEYKNYLMQNYDCLKNTSYFVSINNSLLSKAMRDEKTAEWLEYNLSIMPQVMEPIMQAKGHKVLYCHTIINGYDSMTTELVTRSEADSGAQKIKDDLKKLAEKKQKEQVEQNIRAKKKQLQEDIEKIRNNSINLTYEGNNINDIAQLLISAMPLNSSAKITKLDINA